MTKIGIILGSTRPGRRGEQVARWVHDLAAQRGDAEFEVVDLLDHPLPHLDASTPASMSPGPHEQEHTRAWAETVASFDGFVIVTPEYNHSLPGVLKNALDHVYYEWNNKAVGFVSYGGAGGARAVEQLRLVCGALHMADVAMQVVLPLATEFENFTTLKPGDYAVTTLGTMLDHVVAWSTALAPLRATSDQRETDEAAIRRQIAGIVEDIGAKDLDGLMRHYAADVVSFDVEPPLQHVGIDAKLKNWANAFTFFREVDYEVRDLTLTVGDDVAFGHCFGRLSGTLGDGSATSGMWVRATFCFRKIDGDWLIAHDQASVPFDIRSGRGVVDLEP
jgi:NAD(P)H-dependent FMN reductase/ketosteroid isomerase-like protein